MSTTPFRVNINVGDVGHTVVIRPTGTGMSTYLDPFSCTEMPLARGSLHSSLSTDALLERLADIERLAAGSVREQVARLREDIIVDDWGPYPYIDALVQGRNEPWGMCTLLVFQQRYGGQYTAIVAPDADWATTAAAGIDEHTLEARELAARLEEAAVLGLGQRPSDALRALDNRLAIRDATHDNPRALVTAYEVILGREP